MPRQDFNEFLRLTKDGMNEHIDVYSWVNHRDYYLPFVKLCDNRTRLVIRQTISKLPLGIWVDIFPLDGGPDRLSLERFKRQANALERKASIPVTHYGPKKDYVWLVSVFLHWYYRIMGQSRYLKKISNMAEGFRFDQSEFVAALNGMDARVYPGEWFGSPIEMRLGDETYAVMKDYDAFLRCVYGEYMQLPPEEERRPPQIQSYWV